MKNQTSFSHSARTRFALSCLLAAIALPACYDIEIETETPDEPTADSYSVDIYMLSELAGRILPQEKKGSTYLCEKTEGGWHELVKTESNDNSENAAGDESGADSGKNGDNNNKPTWKPRETGFDIEATTVNEKTQLTLTYNHYGLDGSQTKNYTLDAKILAEDELKDVGISESTIKDYKTCYSVDYSYYVSGLSEIYDLWEREKNDSSNNVYVGNGDNFGVSSIQSRAYDDVPTIMALNTIGFTADTFGNHSFDKNLSYLNNLINLAKFPFVASNLTYQPQNFDRFNFYKIVPLEPDSGEPNNVMNLAIVGATDFNIVDSVYPGRFGSLGFGKNDSVGHYCYTIQAMEEAYNEGARAFLILGHIYEEFEYSQEFYSALFSLIKDDQSFYCPTRLTNLNKEDTVSSIRRKIFNGLIGVFGAATEKLPIASRVTAINTNEKKLDEQSILTDEKNQLSTQFLFGEDYYQYLVESEKNNNIDKSNNDIEAIWLFRFPANGAYTAKAKVEIKKLVKDNTTDKKDNTIGKADTYQVYLNSFALTPVLSGPLDDTLKTCDELFTKHDKCADYYDDVKEISKNKSQATNDVFSDFLSTSGDCYKYIEKLACSEREYANGECKDDSDKGSTAAERLAEQLKIWACLYNATSKEINGTDFESLDLPNIAIPATDKKTLRTQTTELGNLVTQSIFDYYNKEMQQHNLEPGIDDPYNYDFLYFNAGIVRETLTPVDKITSDWLLERLPYDNTIIELHITGTHKDGTYKTSGQILSEIFNHGFAAGKGTGQYPMPAQVVASYGKTGKQTEDNKDILTLCELWTVDDDGALYKPLYYSKSNECKDEHLTSLNHTDNTITFSIHNKSLGNEFSDKSSTFSIQVNSSSKDFIKNNSDTYSTDNDLHVLISDYMATGGDKYYSTLANIKKEDVIGETLSMNAVIAEYLSTLSNEELGKFKKKLNYNHIFPISDTEE